jgi:antitoxin PrlF
MSRPKDTANKALTGPVLSAKLENGKSVSYLTPMNRVSRPIATFSKVSVKSQTVIPREVRERLRLKPGDTLRYRVTDDGILLDKATEAGDDPFAAFSEWTSEADEKAYGEL